MGAESIHPSLVEAGGLSAPAYWGGREPIHPSPLEAESTYHSPDGGCEGYPSQPSGGGVYPGGGVYSSQPEGGVYPSQPGGGVYPSQPVLVGAPQFYSSQHGGCDGAGGAEGYVSSDYPQGGESVGGDEGRGEEEEAGAQIQYGFMQPTYHAGAFQVSDLGVGLDWLEQLLLFQVTVTGHL